VISCSLHAGRAGAPGGGDRPETLDEEPSIVVVDSATMLRESADERVPRGALYDLTSRISQTD
jgi:hypothetical protein